MCCLTNFLSQRLDKLKRTNTFLLVIQQLQTFHSQEFPRQVDTRGTFCTFSHYNDEYVTMIYFRVTKSLKPYQRSYRPGMSCNFTIVVTLHL